MPTKDDIWALEQAVMLSLESCHYSEYELIKRLKGQGFFPFLQSVPAAPHALFCAHFLLFHVLYRLRDRLWEQQQGDLQISPLVIQLLPYQPGQAQLSQLDPLREYYLDFAQLQATSTEDVEALLSSFWSGLAGQSQRGDALAQLGLGDPVSDAAIRRRYRELVMQHHPDRGGEHHVLQALNKAMAVLKL